MTSKNILVTGPPRCGKSTLIEKVILRIEKPMTGFFTREIKEKGGRIKGRVFIIDRFAHNVKNEDTTPMAFSM